MHTCPHCKPNTQAQLSTKVSSRTILANLNVSNRTILAIPDVSSKSILAIPEVSSKSILAIPEVSSKAILATLCLRVSEQQHRISSISSIDFGGKDAVFTQRAGFGASCTPASNKLNKWIQRCRCLFLCSVCSALKGYDTQQGFHGN